MEDKCPSYKEAGTPLVLARLLSTQGPQICLFCVLQVGKTICGIPQGQVIFCEFLLEIGWHGVSVW